jgi:hypothetical protein
MLSEFYNNTLQMQVGLNYTMTRPMKSATCEVWPLENWLQTRRERWNSVKAALRFIRSGVPR